MKGSAITGPVAKECVCTHMCLFRLTMLICNNRRTYGHVLRRTQAQWSRLMHCLRPHFSLTNQIVISCTKMPIHLHAYMKIALCIALQDYKSILSCSSSVAQLVALAFISPCEIKLPPKVHHGYRTKIKSSSSPQF
jgi:hypothetical protein